jgi:hypothetical protein
MDDEFLIAARAAASAMMAERGYDAEARLIASGRADDFSEVRTALHLMRRIAEAERAAITALEHYAGDEESADRGALAREALRALGQPVETRRQSAGQEC